VRILVTAEGRICTKCDQEKPWSEFYRKSNGFNGRTSECRSCRRAYDETRRDARRAYLATWRAQNQSRQHAYQVKQHYGLEHGEYDKLLTGQGGLCAACRQPESMKRRLSVDHDHETGAVRGLLCNACNRAIGLAKDDPARLEGCAAYLRRASSES